MPRQPGIISYRKVVQRSVQGSPRKPFWAWSNHRVLELEEVHSIYAMMPKVGKEQREMGERLRLCQPRLFQNEEGERLQLCDTMVGGRSVGIPGIPALMETTPKKGSKIPRTAKFLSGNLVENGFAVLQCLSALADCDAER